MLLCCKLLSNNRSSLQPTRNKFSVVCTVLRGSMEKISGVHYTDVRQIQMHGVEQEQRYLHVLYMLSQGICIA